MTAKTKVVNYTADQTATMINDYADGVSVETIAANMGKTVRSVIAKLSREKVYVAKTRTTKTGEAIVKKDAVADEIGMLMGFTEAEIESLAKANKTVLKALVDVVKAVKLTDANDVS